MEHPFYNSISMKLDIYIPIFTWKSLISYPKSVITQFSDLELIRFAHLNKWMWSYRPPNWSKMDPNKRCAHPSTKFRWSQKMLELLWRSLESGRNSVSLNNVTIMQKLIWFSYVHTQNLLNWSLSKVHNTSLKIKRSEMDSRPFKTL